MSSYVLAPEYNFRAFGVPDNFIDKHKKSNSDEELLNPWDYIGSRNTVYDNGLYLKSMRKLYYGVDDAYWFYNKMVITGVEFSQEMIDILEDGRATTLWENIIIHTFTGMKFHMIPTNHVHLLVNNYEDYLQEYHVLLEYCMKQRHPDKIPQVNPYLFSTTKNVYDYGYRDFNFDRYISNSLTVYKEGTKEREAIMRAWSSYDGEGAEEIKK